MKYEGKLTPEQICRTFDPEIFEYLADTNYAEQNIIGQPRAVAALKFGLGIKSEGFHIYVSGQHGTGRMTAIKKYLQEIARKDVRPCDWCYVNNFDDAYKPVALSLPYGKGREFQTDVARFVEEVRKGIPKAYEQDEYTKRRETITQEIEQIKNTKMEEIKAEAKSLGFVTEFGSGGILMLPIVDDKPVSDDEAHMIPLEKQNEILKKRQLLESYIKEKIKELRNIDHQAVEKFKLFDREFATRIVEEFLENLIEKYKELPLVINYLKSLQKNIIENIDVFRYSEKMERSSAFQFFGSVDLIFRKYKVNVMVDHSKTDGAPVVVDITGSYASLFGRIEKEAQLGVHYTDFTLIKPGSLHEANGGYLILEIEDLLRNHLAWDSLKRALRSKMIRMEDLAEKIGIAAGTTLQPESIPLNLKVILLGSSFLYSILHIFDEDFSENFKVAADFDTRMPATYENIGSFVVLLKNFCKNEKTNALTPGGAAKLAQYACRLTEDQQNLSTRFGILIDVIREADYWSKSDNESKILPQHITKAIEQRFYRSGLLFDHSKEMILRDLHLIDTDGSVIAQMNGVSVFKAGTSLFGIPTRITATSAAGREGVIDIEREANLGGPIHSKGVLILSGYLAERFAQDLPLSLSAKIVFEQSYSGVEGDSASCAELCALLSSLSGLPLNQAIAVTGSVNQHGKLQSIGGVNEKVEGFFDICKSRGLTNKQGVIIPKSNIQNLMLREDVVEAVRNGQFHLWALKNVDEVIEMLTDTEAGEFEEGSYPIGTVNYLVHAKLKQFASLVKETDLTRPFFSAS
jgi:predicted ATP-dependent protease